MKERFLVWWRKFVQTQQFEISLFVVLLAVGSFIAWGIYRVMTAPPMIKAAVCSEITPTASMAAAESSTNNLVANSSMELTEDDDSPVSWLQGQNGHNSTSFTYADTGHTGQRSLAVAVTDFTDGGASWSFQPVGVVPSGIYVWSGYYQSDTISKVGADIALKTGEHVYIEMGELPPAKVWQRASYTLLAPLNAATVSVYQLLPRSGKLSVDDVSFALYDSQRLDEGMVSLTFDDGLRETYEQGLPLMEKYDITSTQYIVSEPIIHPAGTYYIDEEMVKDFLAKGHEVASHTAAHADLTILNEAQLDTELETSYSTITNMIKAPTTDFASPYGKTTPDIVNQIKKIYCSHRNTFSGFNTPSAIDPYNIVVQDITKDTSVEQIEAWIDVAREQRVWVVLVMHEVEQGGREYSFSPQNLEKVLKHIKDTHTKTVTVQDALKQIRQAQLDN